MRDTVLVIEDDERLRKLLREQLSAAGFSPLAAEDGERGLQLLTEGAPPSVVILDIRLPGIDGWEVLQRLKSNPRSAAVPVVILSALNGADDLIRGYTSGADYYIAKPYDSEELLRGLKIALHGLRPNVPVPR